MRYNLYYNKTILTLTVFFLIIFNNYSSLASSYTSDSFFNSYTSLTDSSTNDISFINSNDCVSSESLHRNDTVESIANHKLSSPSNLILTSDPFIINKSKEVFYPNDNAHFTISGNSTEITNYTLKWYILDPTGEFLCNSDLYLGTVQFNETNCEDYFYSEFVKPDYYDLYLFNSYQITHIDNYSICDITLKLPSHSLILGDYLFNITLTRDNETIIEERIFPVEDIITVTVEECHVVRGYNSLGAIFEKENWYSIESTSKNYLSPGDNVSLIVSLIYQSTNEIINTTIAPLKTEITLYNSKGHVTDDFTQLINYDFSANNFMKGNFSSPYNNTNYFLINFAIPISLDFFGNHYLRMDTTFDSDLANHTTAKYNVDPIIVDFTVSYHMILEEFSILDNNIDSQTFSVGENLDGSFKISIKHYYLKLAEYYPENNIDTIIAYEDDSIDLKLYATKFSDNTTFSIDISKINHGEYIFSKILSLNFDNNDYYLSLEYKANNWEDDEYNSLVIDEDNNIIGEFYHEFAIVTKFVAKIENHLMELNFGTEIILEVFIDGETETKYGEELDLDIWDDDDHKLSYTYDSEENKYIIWKNQYYEVGLHWLLIEINEEDLDCKLYRKQITTSFTVYQKIPPESSTEANKSNDIDLEETIKMILLLGPFIGITALALYIIIYNIRIKLKK